MSARHKEALAHLLYGLGDSGGFVQLTGEVGTGKTTICRCLLEQVPENVDLAVVLNPKVTAIELISTVCDELGIEYPAGFSIKGLTDVLNIYLLEAFKHGRRTVLIIDEAQNLSADVLEQVRLLTNLETATQKLLQIVLIGQPELRSMLASDELRQLSQRITARYHLDPISRKETEAYIKHRLQICGNSGNIFSFRTINRIHRLSGGVPRLINVLCDRAMLGAYVEGKTEVDLKVLKKAAREVIDDARPGGGNKRMPWQLAVLTAVFALGALFVYQYFQQAGIPVVRHIALAGGERAATSVPAPETVSVAPALVESMPDEPVLVEQPMPVEPVPAELVQADPVPGYEAVAAAETETETGPASHSLAYLPRVTAITGTGDAAGGLSGLLLAADDSFERDSWDELFALWSVELPGDADPDYCEFAKQYSLQCLRGKGNWNTLRQFDRPVILMLAAKNGRRIPVVLEHLDSNFAELIIGEELYRMEVGQVDRFWYGDYLLLFQTPPGGKLYLRAGSQAEDVRWLRNQLELVLDVKIPADNPLLFDQKLKWHLLDFQKRRGLVADGVMGRNTIIHLNSVSSLAGIPRLSAVQS
ncbi:MAG: AAA family ATPase [Gammaproteobacteria bacterium]